MSDRLPLPTLLSQVLVAFTIEFDNEFEHQIPHRTTDHGSTGSRSAPWLVSMVMWLKFMRFVPSNGISVRDLQQRTRLNDKEMQDCLTRMSKWWGYVIVEPDAAGTASKRHAANWIVRPTPGGQKALQAWRPLTGIVEKRWQERFGKDVVDRIRDSTQLLVDKMDGDLPDSLPILGYELLSERPDYEHHAPTRDDFCPPPSCALPILLSKLLFAYATEFERDSKSSLAISANVLRLMGKEGVRVRDLPRLSGVSREAIAMSLDRLEKGGLAIVRPESHGNRVKTLLLTSKGRRAQDAYRELIWVTEKRWQATFGKTTIMAVRNSLECLVGNRSASPSPLFRGLEPYPEGWRASVRRPEELPHYPMVLHRGGFPDGS